MYRTLIFTLCVMLGMLFPCYAQGQAPIVCTTSILEDWLRQIVAPETLLLTLIPHEADPHTFELSPQRRIQLQKAKLIIGHSPYLEGHLLGAIQAASPGKVVYLSDSIEPGNSVDKVAGLGEDPHTWMDPKQVLAMLDKLCETLCTYEPSQASLYKERTKQYKQELEKLDRRIEELLSSVPPQRRYLICQHNNLFHFAKRYGFKVLATLHTHNEEPSAGHYKHLLGLIQSYAIPAIFYDPREEDRLVKNLARTANIKAEPLLVEALHAKAPSYKALLEYTSKTLVSALKD